MDGLYDSPRYTVRGGLLRALLAQSPASALRLCRRDNNDALRDFVAECNRTTTSEEAIEAGRKAGL